MTDQPDELFAAVDSLLAAVDGGTVLPAPAERVRLRETAGLTQAAVAQALGVRVPSVQAWEAGRAEPRGERLQAYRRLLDGLAHRYPAAPPPASATGTDPGLPHTHGTQSRDADDAGEVAVGHQAPGGAEQPSAGRSAAGGASAGQRPAGDDAEAGPSGGESADGQSTGGQSADGEPVRGRLADGQSAGARPASGAAGRGPASVSRRPAARKGAAEVPRNAPRSVSRNAPRSAPADAADPRFVHGPLAVVDVAEGEVNAYCVGGLVLDVPAKSLPALVEWTLAEAMLGQPRLHRSGKDADPLVVLTAAACERYGLPAELSDEERLAGRIPESHKVVRQLKKADWQLTKRGFGPWARIYRPAQGGRRNCVQLCLPSWHALDARHWGDAAELPPVELARVLGTYAARVLTPRGSTAVTGLELMTALHPPTRAVKDDHDQWVSAPNPGALTQVVDCAPCEAPDGHPLLDRLPRFHQRTPAEMLREEAYDWARPLTDEECMRPYLVGIDVNMAFAAAANRTVVGLGAPVHAHNPAFDPSLPGSWLVDLSHIRLDPRLPSPFTPDGDAPLGPAWYATPTVAYARELGYEVDPLEAYVRPEHGPYLDAWYTRLRDAYVATMADLGVTTGMTPEEFLAAMDGHKDRDPQLALVLAAIKATVKGGIGKLRERARTGWRPGERWPALERPTWRPDIRAAVISKARINMHRKMLTTARTTGQYPVAVLSDCAVYASDGPGPLDFLPYKDGRPVPGGFRIGVSPGMVKHEGTQSVLWAEGLREEHGDHLNLARYIKSGRIQLPDAGE
ncbi:telomere-associated protein Tap [Streptomyces sp. HUAS TT20]|uniref:telomere-associated protein Tap n=1 Tax=Streptomyces sp. HUAS TT20 TaxID=3447509 RepID=UPI0021D8DD70|nr:helix-turn-helix domain-containing protein [Streptomyces sp. HUAS 15-9]UXY25728.1 helix-turn-helix domain-containing protein [Streptomyces sp. HUAS 15-9]